jgi:hypothetical protein
MRCSGQRQSASKDPSCVAQAVSLPPAGTALPGASALKPLATLHAGDTCGESALLVRYRIEGVLVFHCTHRKPVMAHAMSLGVLVARQAHTLWQSGHTPGPFGYPLTCAAQGAAVHQAFVRVLSMRATTLAVEASTLATRLLQEQQTDEAADTAQQEQRQLATPEGGEYRDTAIEQGISSSTLAAIQALPGVRYRPRAAVLRMRCAEGAPQCIQL